MNITSDTYVDSKGILTVETHHEDEDFGFGMVQQPFDIIKIDFLTNCCRLRYSEINGKLCTDPNPPSPGTCSDPVIQKMTGTEYLKNCEISAIEHARWQINQLKFNAPGYLPVLEILISAIELFHSLKEHSEELSNVLKNAIDVGNKYLSDKQVKINQRINFDYVIQQPIV